MDPIKANSTDEELKALASSWSYAVGLPAWILLRLVTLERTVLQLNNRAIEIEAALDREPEYPRK